MNEQNRRDQNGAGDETGNQTGDETRPSSGSAGDGGVVEGGVVEGGGTLGGITADADGGIVRAGRDTRTPGAGADADIDADVDAPDALGAADGIDEEMDATWDSGIIPGYEDLESDPGV